VPSGLVSAQAARCYRPRCGIPGSSTHPDAAPAHSGNDGRVSDGHVSPTRSARSVMTSGLRTPARRVWPDCLGLLEIHLGGNGIRSRVWNVISSIVEATRSHIDRRLTAGAPHRRGIKRAVRHPVRGSSIGDAA
jgi:hypothetical protein